MLSSGLGLNYYMPDFECIESIEAAQSQEYRLHLMLIQLQNEKKVATSFDVVVVVFFVLTPKSFSCASSNYARVTAHPI